MTPSIAAYVAAVYVAAAYVAPGYALPLLAAGTQTAGSPAAAATADKGVQRPRVFVTESNSWQTHGGGISGFGSGGGGFGGGALGGSAGGASPQTAEIIKTRSPAPNHHRRNFVGQTPSTLSLAPGQHKITISRKGYNDWSRQMTTAAGTVHLSAELDAK